MVPPFHANPDNHHCLQCTLRMALETVRPGRSWTIDELDRLTLRRRGEGTWTHAAYLALGRLGVEARAYDRFDYAAFAADPLNTVLDTFPPRVAHAMAQGFDLVSAAGLARELLAQRPISIVSDPVDLTTVDGLVDDGWLVIANVDATILDGGERPSGHSLLVYDRTESAYIAHDPGTDGQGVASRHVPRHRFEAAWSFMGPEHRELLAFAPVD